MKLPEVQIDEYRERYKKWEEIGFKEDAEDWRIKYYSDENIMLSYMGRGGTAVEWNGG